MLGVVRAGANYSVCFGPGNGLTICTSGSVLPMSGPRVMPLLGCENDIGGRFTAETGCDSQGGASVSDCAEVSCVSASRSAGAGRDAPTVTGATPPLDAPVVAWVRVCFHTPRPRGRSLPSMDPCGKAGRPMPEASDKFVGLATADLFSTYRPRPAPRRGSRPPCGPRCSRARETC